MSETVIKVENLYKEYKLGVINHGTLTHDLQSWWARMRGKDDPNSLISAHHNINAETNSFLALKDINFEVKAGERLGIIGKNGAGKSTLLKILSKITSPTKGNVKIRGRVGSLLEVGTGFHPELTGRENIYLNGAILGMRRKEIDTKLDEIVDFSGIEKHLDTPVKRYSSGMNVRLGFAVAAHLEPEILVIDEVLAVGDIAFQKKCLGKMSEVSKEGRTILFVSHNLASVTNLCNKGIVLDKGASIYEGDASSATAFYTNQMMTRPDEVEISDVDIQSNKVTFISARIVDKDGQPSSSVNIHDHFTVEMRYAVGEGVSGVPLPVYHFKTADEVHAFVVSPGNLKPVATGIYISICKVPGNLLNDGVYNITLDMVEHQKVSTVYHYSQVNYLNVTVQDSIIDNPNRYNYGGPIPGVMRPILDWDIKKVE